MNTTEYYQQLKTLREQDLSKYKPIKVAVLRSYSAEMLEPILSVELLQQGFNPSFFWGDYNQYTQEILNPNSSLHQFKPDLILLLIRAEEFVPALFSEDPNHWQSATSEAKNQLSTLLTTLIQNVTAPILIQNFSLTSTPALGVFDSNTTKGQASCVSQLNQQLLSLCNDSRQLTLWDYQAFVAQQGWQNLYDPKLWYFSSNPFKASAYILIAQDIMRYIAAMFGKLKKCIVLDLDNTLWGGVIGEDGLNGIKLSQNAYPGNCFVALQERLKALTLRGFILAINSKNNESDAWEVFDKHPDCHLKRSDFVAHRINWQDKASNLRSLAEELNIGLDSLIFLDDNPVECDLVRQSLPMVEVKQIPKKPYLIPDIIDQLSNIENIRITAEDSKKGDLYQAENKRKQAQKSTNNLDDYLASLAMKISIEPLNEFNLPRIAQLTQKTNQFNMTTIRHTETELQALAATGNHFIYCAAAEDKFGKHGIISVFILEINGAQCIITDFLMSCRVIARTIETTLLAYMSNIAREHGCDKLVGKFAPTVKNLPAAQVYLEHGFTKTDDNCFSFDLSKKSLDPSAFIELI